MRIPIVFIVLAAYAAHALSQAPEEPLEQVLVTASRTPVQAIRAGSSYTVIGRAELERRQIVHVADALRDVPGFALSRAGAPGSLTQLRVRGAESNHVMVFIDGVEANDPASVDEFLFEHLMATEIERIEIIRGPQSALWGSDALAGVINVITARGTSPLSANGYLESGSFGTTHAGGRFSSSGAAYDFNVGISHFDTNGANVSRTGAEDDGSRNSTLNLTAGAKVSERTRLDLFARHTDATTDFDGTDFITTGLPTDADKQTDATRSYLRISANTSFFDHQWSHRFSLTGLETDNRNYDHDFGISLGETAAEKLGLYYQTSLALAEFKAHRLTFAVDHEKQEFSQRGLVNSFGDPNQDQKLDTTGYLVEYQGMDLGSFSMSAAVRHDKNSEFEDISTYRVTLAYLAGAAKTRLHASLGTGQKSPTFIERFGYFAEEFIGNPNVKPEKSEGWEIGVEQTIGESGASFSVVYFNEELEDEIDGFVFDPTTFLFTVANRSGISERKGLEVSLDAALLENLDLGANYTYLDSTELASLGETLEEVRRPEHMLAVNLNYIPVPRANINLNVSYNGSQEDVIFPPYPQPSARVELDGYTLVNVAVAYRLTPSIQLFGRVENLLDEDYEDIVGFNTPGIGAFLGVRIGR